VGSRQNHLPERELLRARIAYSFTTAFLLSAIIIIARALWLGEFHFAIVAFVLLTFIAETIIAALFGQKKTTVMLYEIIRDLLRKILGK
jgi:hypothetical protein